MVEDKPKFIKCPKHVPYKFAKLFRERIEKNHDQTLERLKEKGGLCPMEFCAAMYNLPYELYWGKKEKNDAQMHFAIIMINMKLEDFKKSEGAKKDGRN